ncbi:LytR/AlgR family response regulator transcription factor [Rhizosphaericola mali]|uniref:Response regulator transcription factor n=1 Tax=Rhizosphaericola mali TaxID=2545455 RepID=A0A5P2G032_9BACT|nr:LytTR family DNA-binding domain-containing protein [Rhizosphaericola mali]QES87150.1 response regulator transcription factor [Rhizosphaericola mali]
MNVLIVDDEPIAQHILNEFCQKIPLIKSITKADNAIEAFDKIKSMHFDLLFLDIQMPEMDGLTLAKLLPSKSLNIIFTTAYSEYALDAFELNVVDYLMKPFSFERFQKAVQKAIENSHTNKDTIEDKEITSSDTLFVKIDGQFRKISINDILYLEALSDYVKIHTLKKENFLISTSMKAMEERLPAKMFCRIHNSYIIAVNKVETIFGNTVELSEHISLPISRSRKEQLFTLLQITD